MPENKHLTFSISEKLPFDWNTLKAHIPSLPKLDLSHIHRLTNKVGILQHAKYTVPNYHHGYCVDDNARALILVAMAYHVKPDPALRELMNTYLAYLFYMQLENGQFRNFLSFDNSFLDEVGSEDSCGRTIWALGFFLKTHPHSEFAPLAQEMFLKALPNCQQLRSNRAVAYCLLGLLHYYEEQGVAEPDILHHISALSSFLHEEFNESIASDWQWFEKIISYDNALIPLSLLRVYSTLGNDTFRHIGMTSALFLDKVVFSNGYLSTVGNTGWFPYQGNKSKFGQQPIEVPSTLLLYKQLYFMTGDAQYKKRMIHTFQWFFGRNDLNLQLYDPISKGCSDGLDRDGTNENQGAESTISFWTAYLYLCTAFD